MILSEDNVLEQKYDENYWKEGKLLGCVKAIIPSKIVS